MQEGGNPDPCLVSVRFQAFVSRGRRSKNKIVFNLSDFIASKNPGGREGGHYQEYKQKIS